MVLHLSKSFLLVPRILRGLKDIGLTELRDLQTGTLKYMLLCSICIWGSLEPDYQKILLYSHALALTQEAVALCFISLSPECSI